MLRLKDVVIQRKNNQLNEGLEKSKLIDIAYSIKEDIGEENFLNDLMNSMDVDALRDILKYICRAYELKYNIN